MTSNTNFFIQRSVRMTWTLYKKDATQIQLMLAKLLLKIKKKASTDILNFVETHLDLMLTLKMAKKSFMQKISKEGKHLGVPNNGDKAYLMSFLEFHAPLDFTKDSLAPSFFNSLMSKTSYSFCLIVFCATVCWNAKGQSISKRFWCFEFFQNTNKNNSNWGIKVIKLSFFGRIQNTKKTFRN